MIRLGILADPDMPQRVAHYLARRLPDRFRRGDLTVEVEVDPLTAGMHATSDILEATRRLREERDWDYAICLTDLPVRAEHRPVLADASISTRVAVVSLPALGGLQPFRRATELFLGLLDELVDPLHQPAVSDPGGTRRHGLGNRLTRKLVPIRRSTTRTDEVDVRYDTTPVRGRLRLITGMVRTNRPWRLVFGLSSALAAAVATSVYGLTSSTVWQIGDQIGPTRQILTAVVAVALLVFWLIAAHHLWEIRGEDRSSSREQTLLYNTSTVATLVIGVAFLYAILLVLNYAVAAFLVPSALLTEILGHNVDWTSYLTLAWAFTTMGMVAGALGSSLESDAAVRQAAYGYRERQRRIEHHRQRES